MKNIKPLIFTCILLFAVNIVFAQSSDEKAIRAILDTQSSEWNKGNVEGFMHGYWDNDSLMFIDNNGISYGWKKALDNYKKGYPDTTSMGKLDFKLLKVNKLSGSYYFVIGKWHLARTKGDVGGAFTLLFRKINNKWVIVADHSS